MPIEPLRANACHATSIVRLLTHTAAAATNAAPKGGPAARMRARKGTPCRLRTTSYAGSTTVKATTRWATPAPTIPQVWTPTTIAGTNTATQITWTSNTGLDPPRAMRNVAMRSNTTLIVPKSASTARAPADASHFEPYTKVTVGKASGASSAATSRPPARTRANEETKLLALEVRSRRAKPGNATLRIACTKAFTGQLDIVKAKT